MSQAVFGLALLLGSEAAISASFQVNPVRVTLVPGSPTASLTVRNDSATQTVIQIGTHRWYQEDGRDVLEPTSDVLATPPIFTVAPGGSQVVRVGLRREAAATEEVTYRLLLDEIPPPPGEDFQGMQVALRLSLPVFVLPARQVAPELKWSAGRTESGDLQVRLRNAGSAHVKVNHFTLAAAESNEGQVTRHVSEYVLPGQERGWRVEGYRPGPGSLDLTAATDAGDHRAQLLLDAP